MALQKVNRLTKEKDFQRVFESGKTVKGSFLFIKFLKSEQKRFGIVVSSKVSKKAVVRNRIKRMLSEVIRKRLKNISNADVVIVANSNIVDKEFTEIEKMVIDLLKKGGLLK